MASRPEVPSTLRLSEAQQKLIEESIKARLAQFNKKPNGNPRAARRERGRIDERNSPSRKQMRGLSAPPPKKAKKKKKKASFLSLRARKERKKKKQLQSRARTLSLELSKSQLYQDRKSTAKFGKSLRQLMTQQKITHPDLRVPVVIWNITNAIRGKLHTIGLFRVPAVASDVNEIRETIDRGEELKYDELQPHVLAGLFKLFFKKLPTPVFTFQVYNNVLDFAHHPEIGVEKILQAVDRLPSSHHNILDFLLDFLVEVAEVKENRMDLNSLAIVISPNLIRPKIETEATILEDTKVLHVVIAHLLHHRMIHGSPNIQKHQDERSVELSRAMSDIGGNSDSDDAVDGRGHGEEGGELARHASELDFLSRSATTLKLRACASDVGLPRRAMTMRR